MPASAATVPREHEEDHLDPLDAQPREAGRLLVGADGEDRAPEAGRVQQHREGDGEHGEEGDRVRHRRARELVERPVGPRGREVVSDWSPMTTNARPRNSASVPMVTAREGRPSCVTSAPLNAPQSAPTTRQTTMIVPIE